MIDIAKRICYPPVPKRKGHSMTLSGFPWGGSRLVRSEGECGQEPSHGFLGREWVRQGQKRLVWILSAACGVEGLSLVAWYLALGSVGQVHNGLQCESPITEEVEGVDSGWVSLHMKASSLASPGTGRPCKTSQTLVKMSKPETPTHPCTPISVTRWTCDREWEPQSSSAKWRIKN